MHADDLLGRSFAIRVWLDERTQAEPEVVTFTGVNPVDTRPAHLRLTPFVPTYRVYHHGTGTRHDLTFGIVRELEDAEDIEEVAYGPDGA